MKMLASRRRRKAPATRQPRLARRSFVVACATAIGYLGDGVLLRFGRALVAGLRREVRLHVRLGHEQEARVGVGRSDQATRQLVEEELDDGLEALEVRLLVDRE